MSAKVTDQVADFCSDRRVCVHDQGFEIIINVCVVDVLIKIFRNSCELGDQTQSVNDNNWVVVMPQESVFVDDAEAVCLHELLGELLAAFSTEHKPRDEGDSDGDGL